MNDHDIHMLVSEGGARTRGYKQAEVEALLKKVLATDEPAQPRTFWLGKELTCRHDRWNSLTMPELRELRQQAERAIEAILGELYLESGIEFEVIKSQHVRSDWLGGEDWRGTYFVSVRAVF